MHPDLKAGGHMSLTQHHGQSLYRKYFTSYSKKPTKLWIKIWSQQKKSKEMPDFSLWFSLVVTQGLGAGSQCLERDPLEARL